MKILVINGSPKKENSNTMKLTTSFIEGAGWENVEIIHIADAEIKGCRGCFACWNKTPGKCIINDDMNEMIEKLIVADIIIWSFPLYYFNVPGILKNFIDRQLPMALPFMIEGSESGGHPSRYDLSHQKHILISTCGFWTAEKNYDSVIPMFDHFCGEGNYIKIFCGQGELFKIPELRNRTDEYLEYVHKAGAEYVSGGISKKTHSMLTQPLYPQSVFEKMADASWDVSLSGEKEITSDDSLSFTKQMAALYIPDGKDRVLEFFYTDIGKTYQILLTSQGSEVITDGFQKYSTKIETPYSVWRSISKGEISGQDAMFQKLYKVLGDFDLMLKWDELFGGATPQKQTIEKSNKKTNMMVFLFPWIVIWVFLAINATIGGSLGIISAAVVPLLWFFFRPVAVEQISISIVAGLSLFVLLGADVGIILPITYLSFALIWLIGSFTKIPLTAHYSAMQYGDEKAFNNPLFMQTNRILTATWGFLYLFTSLWTYFLMGTRFSVYTGLINSICPALMGIFTIWFQRWYPSKYAKS